MYSAEGLGFGGRASIPIVENGFVPSINNSVAISFGMDVLFFSGCGGPCSATFLDFPVAMQWNFFVAQRWSVFGEPGLALGHGFISGCPAGANCPTDTWFYPAFFAGARYHFSDTTALTMRIGYPYFSLGVSFFP